ncbi:MAG: putative transcriptional regulator [Rhodospirillales bacterium]|jgi:IclR family KDG regulon transcriptional repressor|nr:putative transcriptional regulator [Rhodospirillales bacterium]
MTADVSVKSATRVFEILEFFREVQTPLRLKDIVTRFNYPPSSVAGLLKTMMARGYLTFDSRQRSYFPTAQLFQLVEWIPTVEFEGKAVLRSMKNLQQDTRELIVLGTINDPYVEFIESLRSTHDVQVWTPPGTKRPLINGGMGWLFLSRMLESRSKEIAVIHRRSIAMGLVSEADVPLELLLSRLNEVKGRDYVFTQPSDFGRAHPGHPGGGMVSMLVPCPPGHRPLAIGVGGPADRLAAHLDEIVAQMRAEVALLANAVAAGTH